MNNPEIANLAIRHNLDLYNDVQVENRIRKTAERLEVGTIELVKALHDITSQLEQYRLEQTEQQQTKEANKRKTLPKKNEMKPYNFCNIPT